MLESPSPAHAVHALDLMPVARPFLVLITSEYEPQLYDYIGGTVRGMGGISLELNGMEDHVHLLVKLRPERALSDVLRELKANATGWMHDVFPSLKGFS